MTADSAQIVAEMDRIRRARSEKLAQLSQQSQRLTDWREYVSSAPVASLAGSIAIGVMLGNKLADRSHESALSSMTSEVCRSKDVSSGSGLMGRFMSTATEIAVPIITNAAKRQLLSGLELLVRRMAERQPTPSQ